MAATTPDSHIEPPTDLSGFDRQILILHASSMMVSAKAMPPSPTRAYVSGLAQELLEQAHAPEAAPTEGGRWAPAEGPTEPEIAPGEDWDQVLAEGLVALRKLASCPTLPDHARRAVAATERAVAPYAPQRVLRSASSSVKSHSGLRLVPGGAS